jgi:Na+/H+ antiporter NhaC
MNQFKFWLSKVLALLLFALPLNTVAKFSNENIPDVWWSGLIAVAIMAAILIWFFSIIGLLVYSPKTKGKNVRRRV